MFSIKGKIILTNLVIFGLVLTAFAYMVYNRTAQSEWAVIDSRLEACGAKVITEFEDEWEDEVEPEWDDILDISAEGLPSVAMSMANTSGHVLFASDTFPDFPVESGSRVHAGAPVYETLSRDARRYRQAVIPVDMDGSTEFALTLQTPVDDVAERLGQLTLILFAAVPAALLLASLAVYLTTRLSFAPMARMVKAAEEISAENLDRRVELPAHRDEVTRLGTALNAMMDRIEAAFKSQRQFVADASHELRTPLTVIIGELELVQRQLQQEEQRAGIVTALSELDRLTRLVDQLLTLARIDARKLVLEKGAVRLDELVADCVRLLTHEADRLGIRIELRIAQAVELCGDAAQLKSVILNLMDNAIRYSSRGGSVAVSLLAPAHGMASLQVSDTGPGIAPKERPKVFDRFFRGAEARASTEGSGLGLAIARELAELHGGRITLQESTGGAAFLVELPLP